MKYTRNQHVLSQWVLRNFRSDDTANEDKDKQRVWCHTVYLSNAQKNEIKDIPLPISSIAICKDCFMLLDGENGVKFDIEEELSEYENRTSVIFNELVHNHAFERLLDVDSENSPLETILNFMLIQKILNLNNPQNKMDAKDEVIKSLIKNIIDNIDNIVDRINNLPEYLIDNSEFKIYKKLVRVAKSTSPVYEKSKTLFVLFMLIEAKGLPTIFYFLNNLKNSEFKNINISGVYHTGYEFESTEIRPVFTIGPNVYSYYKNQNMIYLPLSHNLAISFSVGKKKYFNNKVDIFCPKPENLLCTSSKCIRIFRVSFDYIDNITSLITMGNQQQSNTIYTPYELKDIEAYLDLQYENEELFYTPENPELVVTQA